MAKRIVQLFSATSLATVADTNIVDADLPLTISIPQNRRQLFNEIIVEVTAQADCIFRAEKNRGGAFDENFKSGSDIIADSPERFGLEVEHGDVINFQTSVNTTLSKLKVWAAEEGSG